MLLKITLSETVKSIFEKVEKPQPPMEPGTEFYLSSVKGTVIMALSSPHTYVIDFWGLSYPDGTYVKQWLEVARDTMNAFKVTSIRKSNSDNEIIIMLEGIPI
jgi:hypothetical protein